ncbi:MAG: bifunctional riboflavin kinase/FAD synthetase [Bacteriovoracaceae bacterium]|nr:bifunctional riboflavin kinase/FAD synthetase [Bacteriovoracaceae bacterium]
MNTLVVDLDTWKKNSVPASFGVTIGNFDGVHLGHQSLIKDFVAECKSLSLIPVVFTFCPHPCLYFDPEKKHLVSSYNKKYELLKELGVEQIVEIKFDEKLQNMTGKEFANETLLAVKGLQLLWVGHDFTFGRNKEDPSWIEQLDRGISFRKVSPFKVGDETVSSSLIRSYLTEGDVEAANRLLGRKFSIEGLVVHGKKLGREIGFPTINLRVNYPFFIPALGVYKVSCLFDSKIYKGVMNLGKNPSIDDGAQIKVETHLFNFDQEVYDSNVEIQLEKFIRKERKFDSIEQLKDQIALDLAQARGLDD